MRLHQLEHLLHHQRRQPGRRLVHQQQFRLGHQRAADRAHLLLAAGQRAGQLLAAVLQARKQAVNPIELLGETPPRLRNEGADAQIFLDAQPRKQPAVLRHMGDALLDHAMRRQAADRARLPPSSRPRASGSGRKSRASAWSCRRRSARSRRPPRLAALRAKRRTAPGMSRSRRRRRQARACR